MTAPEQALDVAVLRRRLAAIEHERWVDWQRWMHSMCRRTPTGGLVIPPALVERWERQIATPYEQLSEAEQRSDMEQVDRYWPLIEAVLEERDTLVSDLLRLGLHFDVNEADELVVTMVESEVRGEDIPAIRDLLASVAVTALRAAREAEEVERG